jgi:hypothetical protein
VAGIFVGAVGMEILRRQCPNALNNLFKRTQEMASSAKEAFRAGYEKVTRPDDVVAEPGV